MNQKLTVILGILALAIFGSVFAFITNGRSKDSVLDISVAGIEGFKTCPVHNLPFGSEQVSAWHEAFSPHSTRDWWERVPEAMIQYPYAQPFPPQVDNPKIEVVIRSYCAKCRDGFNVFVSKSEGEQAAPSNR